MTLSKGDVVTFVGLGAFAILQAFEPYRREFAIPPESNRFWTSDFWYYLPSILLVLIAFGFCTECRGFKSTMTRLS